MASNAIRIAILANARTAIRNIGRTTRALEKLDRTARKASRGGVTAFSKELSKLGSIVSKAGTILKAGGKTLGVSLMGFVALGVASGVGQVASALTAGIIAAAPALGVLPGIALAAASAFTVLKVATSGVSDAIGLGLKAAMTGTKKDIENYNNALAKMAPAAANVVRELVNLNPALLKVRNAIATKFFKGFTTEIRQLAGTWLPLLTRHGENVATSLNGAAIEISNFFTEGSTVRSITKIFGKLETAISNVSAGLPNLIRGFLPLFSVSASFLPAMTKGFGKATEQFAKFMEQAEKSGALKAFIQGGIDAFKTLTTVLGSIGGILKSVFVDANAGAGSFFTVIGSVLKQVDDFLNTAEGMAAIGSIWETLGVIGKALGDALAVVLPALGDALVALAPAIEPLAQALGKFLEAMAPILPIAGKLAAVFADNLAKALPILAPALLAVGSAIADVLTACAPLIPVVAEVAAIIGTALADAVTELMPSLTPLITALGDGLLTIVKAVAPILPVLATAFSAILDAVTPLIAPIAALIAQFATGMLPIIVALMPSLQQLLAALGPALLQVITALAPYLNVMIASLAAMVPSIIALVAAVVPLIPQFAELAVLLLDNLLPVLEHAPEAIAFLASSLYLPIAALQAIRAGLTVLIGGIKWFVEHAQELFQWWVDWILLLPARIVDGLVGGLSSAWHKVTDFLDGAVKLIPEGISDALGIASPSKVMAGIGAQIGVGLTNGIAGQLPALKKTMGAVSGVVADGVGTDASVKLKADAAITANGAAAGTGPAVVNINVTVPTGADPAETGRQIVKAVQAYQNRTGRIVLVPAL